jgi:hypothetical protein
VLVTAVVIDIGKQIWTTISIAGAESWVGKRNLLESPLLEGLLRHLR